MAKIVENCLLIIYLTGNLTKIAGKCNWIWDCGFGIADLESFNAFLYSCVSD